ncbi:UDP-2,3-diacylglucosamine diphosphatase [Aromatoleum diolicum]|uniref:UDP-2,3-diacylglucosamine hydrolase n=1 Tax=Aromatoleum diolicum TaxID=75796 RepID=A0ABX1Q9U8_9RHOO|nr:UDP-2,3-diacylglucosamine diphosphatase [Aromatoleum diolicum]NMG74805.1 UDP-2,3-diacylglucosamine diphosphatase [Aromatoleum diolicum]
MSALFISDLHLSEDTPENTQAFLAFLDGPARAAEMLYILGDLFEYWAGDDDAETPLNAMVCESLAALSASGVTIAFLPGNRDFLLGEAFAAAAGMRILADPTLIDLDGRPVLLSHGDILCTDDQAYQTYRRQVRDPAWQTAFLNRPLGERKHLIESLRRRSESAKLEKSMEIMDVNDSAVEALLRGNAYPTLIHGHTHRPARHAHRVDEHTCARWVLSDWHGEATYLQWNGREFSARIGHKPVAKRT